jgi:cytidine deaminase
MQLDKDSKNIVILTERDTYDTIRLEELVPDWWGYDRFE